MDHIEGVNKDCSGCLACMQICPKQAINLQNDDLDFYYPAVEKGKCIDCGLCKRVCQCFANIKPHEIKAIYGGKNNDEALRLISRSGGLFSAAAKYILDNGGICYGAALNDNLTVSQVRIDNMDDLHRLQGSKYTQSNVGNTFIETCNDLKQGRIVLYSGTSCMIDGLKRFLSLKNISDKNLFTIDIICHGVTSPVMYKSNLDRVEKETGRKIESVNFRDKEYGGWHSHIESYLLDDGQKIYENYWAEFMYSHFGMRASCYDCKYAKIECKRSDITAADFWGMDSALPEALNDNKGYSLAIVHTEKGRALLDKSDFSKEKTERDAALKYNRKGKMSKPKQYDRFVRDYRNNGFEYVLKKYTVYGGMRFKIKRKIMKLLKRW